VPSVARGDRQTRKARARNDLPTSAKVREISEVPLPARIVNAAKAP